MSGGFIVRNTHYRLLSIVGDNIHTIRQQIAIKFCSNIVMSFSPNAIQTYTIAIHCTGSGLRKSNSGKSHLFGSSQTLMRDMPLSCTVSSSISKPVQTG